MKKIYILLIATVLMAGSAFAQSNDSIERARQQEALLKQQQKEQLELLEQQQKEQQRLQREQQKEQEKAIQEQQRAEEKAEQDRIKEQQRAIKEQQRAVKKEQAKAEQKRKRHEHYATWGRKPHVSADPSVSILTDRRIYTHNNYYNSVGANFGFTFDYHRPVARHWDLNVGFGYRYTLFCYSHYGIVSNNETVITPESYNGREHTINTSSLLLPVKFSHIGRDNHHGWYVGVTPGVMLNKPELGMNRFRLDLTLGTQSKWLIFHPGTEVYFNILPTYKTGTENQIREFGIRITL